MQADLAWHQSELSALQPAAKAICALGVHFHTAKSCSHDFAADDQKLPRSSKLHALLAKVLSRQPHQTTLFETRLT